MRLLLLALLALAPLAFLAGCDSTEDGAEAVLLPQDARYAWSLRSHLVESDSLLYVESSEVRIRLISRSASVPGYQGLAELEMQSSGGRSWSWYESKAEHLYDVAYRAAGSTPMAQPRMAAPTAGVYDVPRTVADLATRHRPVRSKVGSDSLIVRESPRIVYELPLEVGASWVSFTEPFGSMREVVGREVVTVAGGTFACFVIRTEIDVVSDTEQFEWFDYVSEEHGLVLRTTEVLGEYRGPDNQPLGLMRTVERLEMTSGR